MLRKRTCSFLLLCLSLVWFGCSEQNQNTPLSPEQAKIEPKSLSKNALAAQAAQDNQMLSAFAKKLALATANANIRADLVQSFAQSQSREKILALKEMLQMRFAAAVLVNGEFMNAINSHPVGIDVYFPVKAHRQAMLENPRQNFLITYFDGYQNDQQERQFPAWDRQGNEVALTTRAAPETPVLVITQCEHKGNHAALVPCSEPDCGGGGGGGGGGGSRNDVVLDEITIYNDHEPWLKGAPEIKILTWQDPNPDHATGYNYQQFIDLGNVDDENTTYFPNRIIYNWSAGENGPMLTEVFEDDGLAPFDVNDHMAFFNVYRHFNQLDQTEPGECKIREHTEYVP